MTNAAKLPLRLAGRKRLLLAAPVVLAVSLVLSLALPSDVPADAGDALECEGAGAAVPVLNQRTRGLPRSPSPEATPHLAKRVAGRPAAGIGLELKEAEPEALPWFIDSNSPAFWADGIMYLFNSVDGKETTRTSGPSLPELATMEDVALPVPDRPGSVWLEAVWFDAAADLLYGWYHFEPSDLECLTAPAVGAAVSFDRGLTWEDRGLVIENAHPIDCDYDNGYFSGGSGDLSVVLAPDSSYFYFFFSTYAGPLAEQGVAIARASYQSRGQPGTLSNYYEGAFSEPSLGGRATAIFPSSTGWKGPHVEAFWGPSVHWNTYLGRYVMLLNRAEGYGFEQEGVYVSYSQDAVRWSRPQKIVDGGGWYPQVLGLGEGETDSLAGRASRFYQARLSCYTLEFSLQPEP